MTLKIRSDLSHNSGARADDVAFKPKKVAEGTKQWQLKQYAQQTLVSHSTPGPGNHVTPAPVSFTERPFLPLQAQRLMTRVEPSTDA